MDNYQNIILLEEEIDSFLEKPRFSTPLSELLVEKVKQWSKILLEIAYQEQPFLLSTGTIENGIALVPSVVFIGGTFRSGTTLLLNLFDNHPQLSVIPVESRHFGLEAKLKNVPQDKYIGILLNEWFLRFVISDGQEPYWMLGRTTIQYSPYIEFARILIAWNELRNKIGDSTFRPLVLGMLAYTTLNNGGQIPAHIKYWVEKTPFNELHKNKILGCFPKALFLQLVRNPIDVYASYKMMELKAFGKFIHKYSFLNNIKASHKIATKFLNKRDNHIIIVYEKLVEDTKNYLLVVCQFLQIEYTSSLNQQTKSGIISFTNSSFVTNKEVNTVQQIKRDRQLNTEDVQIISTVIGKYSRKLGYAIPDVLWTIQLKIRLIVAFNLLKNLFKRFLNRVLSYVKK